MGFSLIGRQLTTIKLIASVTRDTVLPLAWPIKATDGKSEIREIPLSRGTKVIISVYNSNRSKAVWGDDAHEWKPERWLDLDLRGKQTVGVHDYV